MIAILSLRQYKNGPKNVKVKILHGTEVKVVETKTAPLLHRDSVSSIDSVYVKGVTTQPKTQTNKTKKDETPSSNESMISDEEPNGVF